MHSKMEISISKSPTSFFQKNLSLSIYLLLALAIGCTTESSDGKYGVSGSVSLDGQPLKAGTISFVHQQGQGRPAATMFREGTYSIPAEKGLTPGKYLVKINSKVVSSPPGDASAESIFGPPANRTANAKPAKQKIPAEYNKQSTQIVEVTAAGPNKFDFPIKTK